MQVFMIVFISFHDSESFKQNLNNNLSFNLFKYCLYTLNNVNSTNTFFNAVYGSIVFKNNQIHRIKLIIIFSFMIVFCFNCDKNSYTLSYKVKQLCLTWIFNNINAFHYLKHIKYSFQILKLFRNILDYFLL
jgi:hypothetical protein